MITQHQTECREAGARSQAMSSAVGREYLRRGSETPPYIHAGVTVVVQKPAGAEQLIGRQSGVIPRRLVIGGGRVA